MSAPNRAPGFEAMSAAWQRFRMPQERSSNSATSIPDKAAGTSPKYDKAE